MVQLGSVKKWLENINLWSISIYGGNGIFVLKIFPFWVVVFCQQPQIFSKSHKISHIWQHLLSGNTTCHIQIHVKF